MIDLSVETIMWNQELDGTTQKRHDYTGSGRTKRDTLCYVMCVDVCTTMDGTITGTTLDLLKFTPRTINFFSIWFIMWTNFR